MENVGEILARLIGPLLLTAALGVFYYNNDQLNALVTSAKDEYMADQVYSQASTEYSEDGVTQVSDSQLRSIIAAGTDYVVVVKDLSRGRSYVVMYEDDRYVVETYSYSAGDVVGTLISANEGMEYALAVVNQSCYYSVEQEYDLASNVRRITYRKV